MKIHTKFKVGDRVKAMYHDTAYGPGLICAKCGVFSMEPTYRNRWFVGTVESISVNIDRVGIVYKKYNVKPDNFSTGYMRNFEEIQLSRARNVKHKDYVKEKKNELSKRA